LSEILPVNCKIVRDFTATLLTKLELEFWKSNFTFKKDKKIDEKNCITRVRFEFSSSLFLEYGRQSSRITFSDEGVIPVMDSNCSN